jgi:valyl-tRNA synthetase
MLTQLSRLVADATESLDGYDYARVLERTESFFWGFATITSRWSRPGATATLDPRGGERQQRHARRLVGAAAAFRAISAVCHRGSVVVVAAGSVHRATWPTPAEVIEPIGGEDAGP